MRLLVEARGHVIWGKQLQSYWSKGFENPRSIVIEIEIEIELRSPKYLHHFSSRLMSCHGSPDISDIFKYSRLMHKGVVRLHCVHH